MQKVDKSGNPIESAPVDLEKSFVGLKYSSAKGINDIGKPKNIYTEKYADGDALRVYVPEKIKNEATKVTLVFFFVGENRHEVYDSFNEYIRDGYHIFWDDVRKKEFTFFVPNEIIPAEDKFWGSKPYLEAKYTLQNINGKAVYNADFLKR